MSGERRYFPHLAGALVLASAGLIAFLGKWEGEEQHVAYADALAGGIPTVCKGLTRHVTDTPIIVGERWSAEKCAREERAAIVRVQLRLAQCFKQLPPQDVFDAGSSHAWNFGAPSTCSSGAMAAWNRGDWARGCQRIARGDDGRVVWSFVRDGKNADGSPRFKFVQGLANRRADEAATCSGALCCCPT